MGGRYQTIGAGAGRPGSQRNFAMHLRKSNVVKSTKLKDEISHLRQSHESKMMNRTGGLNNFGTIMNYTKTVGINDQSVVDSFRKWTGFPQTTRNSSQHKLMPGLAAKIVADHRKNAVNFQTADKPGALAESALSLGKDSMVDPGNSQQ